MVGFVGVGWQPICLRIRGHQLLELALDHLSNFERELHSNFFKDLFVSELLDSNDLMLQIQLVREVSEYPFQVSDVDYALAYEEGIVQRKRVFSKRMQKY